MSNEEVLRETTDYLHKQIPITRSMGVRVVRYENGELTLTAPLDLNHNHLGTAFGGSLGAVATLAGYALLWLELRDRAAHVVIRRSTLQFHHPVRGELRAVCRIPDQSTMSAFHSDFARKGKARLSLRVEVPADDRLAVEFEGVFVAVR